METSSVTVLNWAAGCVGSSKGMHVFPAICKQRYRPTLPTAVPTLATSNPQPYVDIKLMQGRPRGTHAMAHSNHKQGTQKVFRFLN